MTLRSLTTFSNTASTLPATTAIGARPTPRRRAGGPRCPATARPLSRLRRDAYIRLRNRCAELEAVSACPACDRVFYMALPPDLFGGVASHISAVLCANPGFHRIVVEKPFGRDTDSSGALSAALGAHFDESDIYRIDHYLGKEMVKSLLILRFANQFFQAIWSRIRINNVQIVFKEPFGTEGRSGYFDQYGIIRDVMQNHLLQIMSIVAMERPVSLDPEAIRDEKVRLLKSIPPIDIRNVVIGQYGPSADGSHRGYREDAGVPADSITPTFACAVLYVNNERWDGVPFILKCGKALNERKAEIRIQLEPVSGNIFSDVARNELVVRVQPEEAVYLKLMNKRPGYSADPVIRRVSAPRHGCARGAAHLSCRGVGCIDSELDLSYASRYAGVHIPEAYESLLLDVLKGDKGNFVRRDELDAAWRIFTPLLHTLERERIQPEPYAYGSRGPSSSDALIQRVGFTRHTQMYVWKPPRSD